MGNNKKKIINIQLIQLYTVSEVPFLVLVSKEATPAVIAVFRNFTTNMKNSTKKTNYAAQIRK